MLVSVARYREITGDTDTPSAVVESASTDAQALLEEELRRPLEQAERTERCRVFYEARGAVVYPAATPITAVTTPTGGTVYGHAIVGADPDPGTWWINDPESYAEVVYTGGYDPDAVDGALLVPRQLERAIAYAARALVNPVGFASGVPDGAVSATVGDVSVQWGTAGSPGAGEIQFDRRLIRRWRRRLELVA